MAEVLRLRLCSASEKLYGDCGVYLLYTLSLIYAGYDSYRMLR
jgi:hypothetical protein